LLTIKKRLIMKKYFYSDGLDKFGPFTLDELKSKGISRTTKIWFDDLGGDWKEAGSLSELKDLFRQPPPPVASSHSNPDLLDHSSSSQPPKSWLIESILATLFCCLPFGVAGIIFASKVESHFYAGRIAEANRASADAKKWTMISFWIGIASIVVVIGFYAVIFIVAATSGEFN